MADEPADHVGVTAEVLRRRVHDDVGAERERPLQERRRERVVDDDACAARVRERGDRGDVDDGERRIGGRLDPHQRGAVGPVATERVDVGEVGHAPLDAGRREHLRHQPERAAVRVVGDHHTLTGREQAQHRVFRGHARSRTRSRARRLRATRGTPRSARRVGLPLRAYSNPWCSPTSVCANVDDRLIGGTTAPVAGSGGWPAWMARVSKPSPLGRGTPAGLGHPRAHVGARDARNVSTSDRVRMPTG